MLVILQSINGVFASPALTAAAWGFAASFVFCVALVLTKRWHGALSMDHAHGVQNVRALLTSILFAGMPAFLFGLAEDITKRVGVTQRLLATMASGVLAWWITNYSLSRVDVWGVDWLLRYTLASVVFTAFAVGGVANSINIIDGFNGLASTMSSLAFIGFGLIAWRVEDHALVGVSIVLAACVWGFFWINWPFGKLFLGDGGSYFIGFALAWVAILLIERNPGVSAFAPLVICAHPITEVIFSIYRRQCKDLHPGHPDRLHFHSLLKQRYVRRWFGYLSNRMRNSLTGVLVGLMTITSVVMANLSYASIAWSVTLLVVLNIGFIVLYIRMVRHRW